jgi:hypothetical protein
MNMYMYVYRCHYNITALLFNRTILYMLHVCMHTNTDSHFVYADMRKHTHTCTQTSFAFVK